MNGKLKQGIILIAKLAVVGGALTYLVAGGKLRLSDLQIAGRHAVPYAVAGVTLLALMLALTMVRYALLLRGVGIRLGVGELVRYSCIGYFFNTFMFGGHGGDLVKMAYVSRASGRTAGAVASALVDRILGLLSVIVLSGAALAVSWGYVATTPALHNLSLAVFGVLGAAGLCAAVGFVALTKGRRWGLLVWTVCVAAMALFTALTLGATTPELLEPAILILGGVAVSGFACLLILPSCQPGGGLEGFVRDHVPLGGRIMGLIQAILAYKDSFRSLLAAFGVSMVLQSINLSAIYLIGLSLAIERSPELQHVFFAWPAAFVVNAMPVPGGGLGVGEVAFDHLLALCGYTGGAAIFLAWRCWLILLGLVGLPLYLLHRGAGGARVSELGELDELQELEPVRQSVS